MIEVIIVSAILQDNNYPKEDLKCSVKLPKLSSETFSTNYDAKNNPYWSKKLFSEINTKGKNTIESVQVKIFIDKLFDKTIAEIYAPFEECLLYPCEYMVKKAYLFPLFTNEEKKPDKIYLKMRYYYYTNIFFLILLN